MIDMNLYCEPIELAIFNFVKEYSNCPYKYIYEADIQGHLYQLINDMLKKKNLKLIFKTKIDQYIEEKTSILHTQTADHTNPKSKFDIGIWDCNDELFTRNYNQKPTAIAIEIKYDFPKRKNKICEYADDIVKLNSYYKNHRRSSFFKGYALWFLPDYNDKDEFRKKAIPVLIHDLSEKMNNNSISNCINFFIITGYMDNLVIWTNHSLSKIKYSFTIESIDLKVSENV